jgi:hypothetical protein
MSRATSRITRLSAVGAAATLITVGGALPALAHGGDGLVLSAGPGAGALAAVPSGPAVTSDNVKFVANFPETQGISGDFSTSTEHFYVSSLDTLSVFDVSTPAEPVLKGTLDNFVFENEAMNYGEQKSPTGKRQFLLVGVDLYQASTDDPQHVNVDDGAELVLVNVTDPTRPRIKSRVKATSSTHTVACIQRTNCTYAYSAGNRGFYSIFDLRDWNNPKEVDSDPNTEGVQGFTSPALAPSLRFRNGAGHKWNFVGNDIAYHTGAAGTAAFDVSRPRQPKLLTTTTDAALKGPWNDFIHHNSWQPHVFQFRPGTRASLANGNVLLITEEDYLETDCSKAGSFQTWRVGSLARPDAIAPLDRVELTDLGGPNEGITPQLAFCSAHWFDYHQTGIVAIGYYGGGTRFLDVRDPKNIKPFGFAQGGGQTWDSYWVPKRDTQGKALRDKTNIAYSVDLVRGLDVYRVTNMPAKRATAR